MILAHPPRPGELLIATPQVHDPWFERSVVLLLDCDDAGSLGVILNRFADSELTEVLPQWADLTCPPQALFAGGPMSPNGAICLAKLTNPEEEPPGWRKVVDDIGLLHLDTPTELVRGAYSDLRIFAGYAGWEAGQLEGELVRGSWYRVASRDDDAFGADPATLWRRRLRRLGGQAAYFSTWTTEPQVN